MAGVAAIFFFFVFIFLGMVAVPYHPRAEADLALASHAKAMPGALREDALVVTVSRDATVFFKDQHATVNDLPELLRKCYENGSERKVFLKADARAKYGDVAAVVDKIRVAGIEKVCFLVEWPARSPQD